MDNNMLINYYEIEGKHYLVINKANYNNVQYLYLVNENDKDDLLIRKVSGDNLEPLDSEEELLNVMKLLMK